MTNPILVPIAEEKCVQRKQMIIISNSGHRTKNLGCLKNNMEASDPGAWWLIGEAERDNLENAWTILDVEGSEIPQVREEVVNLKKKYLKLKQDLSFNDTIPFAYSNADPLDLFYTVEKQNLIFDAQYYNLFEWNINKVQTERCKPINNLLKNYLRGEQNIYLLSEAIETRKIGDEFTRLVYDSENLNVIKISLLIDEDGKLNDKDVNVCLKINNNHMFYENFVTKNEGCVFEITKLNEVFCQYLNSIDIILIDVTNDGTSTEQSAIIARRKINLILKSHSLKNIQRIEISHHLNSDATSTDSRGAHVMINKYIDSKKSNKIKDEKEVTENLKKIFNLGLKISLSINTTINIERPVGDVRGRPGKYAWIANDDSIIIEYLFGSNATDRQEYHPQTLANTVYDVIMEYYNEYYKTSNPFTYKYRNT